MTEREVKQVVVVFSCTLSDKEVPLFRGAMLHAVQGESTLFHDHIGEGFRYRYPLIQYRPMEGYASVIGLEEGGEAIDRFLAEGDICKVRIGRRTEPLLVTRIKTATDNLCSHSGDRANLCDTPLFAVQSGELQGISRDGQSHRKVCAHREMSRGQHIVVGQEPGSLL